MFESQLTRNLKEGEEVVRIVRRYPGSLLFPALPAMAFLLGPFFFLFPLLKLGVFGALGFVILLMIGGILTARLMILYSLNALVITNQRLIDVDQRGFFHREVSESTFDKIQDVSFSMKGVSQTLFRYGTVLIQTAGAQSNLEIRYVQNPERVQELIAKQQMESRPDRQEETDISAEELLRLAQRLKKDLGEEEFQEFVKKP